MFGRRNARDEALELEVKALRVQVEALRGHLEKSQQVQSAALEAVTFLPQEVSSLLDEDNLGDGAMTPDGRGMTYKVGELLQVTIYPFDERLILTDPAGHVQPLPIKFGPDYPVTGDTILRILGFKAMVLRPSRAVSNFWASGMDALTATDAPA